MSHQRALRLAHGLEGFEMQLPDSYYAPRDNFLATHAFELRMTLTVDLNQGLDLA